MSHTDTAPQTSPTTPSHSHPTTSETLMSHLAQRLVTLTALITIVLTVTLPIAEVLLAHPATTTTTATTARTQTTSPRVSKADKAAAHHDGCRQTSSSDDLLARPSCRSGMPVTRDRGLSQVPDSIHDDRGPATLPTVPPAWADHWGAAAHSPHHHSQA